MRKNVMLSIYCSSQVETVAICWGKQRHVLKIDGDIFCLSSLTDITLTMQQPSSALPLSTNAWNFRTEAAKADSIQGRIFGDNAMVNTASIIPDAYGHISNQDALINFASDFMAIDEDANADKPIAPMWGDVSLRDMAIFTSGRGYQALDMECMYYGNTNEYDREGFQVKQQHRDLIEEQGLAPGHPNVSSELLHPTQSLVSVGDDGGSPPPIVPPNGAFGSTDSMSSDLMSIQQSRIKVGTQARTSGVDNVRRVDTQGLDAIAAPYYDADKRAAEMKRTLFVREAYM